VPGGATPRRTGHQGCPGVGGAGGARWPAVKVERPQARGSLADSSSAAEGGTLQPASCGPRTNDLDGQPSGSQSYRISLKTRSVAPLFRMVVVTVPRAVR
jgi:hypothetical protein